MEDIPPAIEPQPAAPQAPTMSLTARLFNVFAIPGDVFADVKTAVPSVANWLVPALLLIVVSWVAAWLIFSQESTRHQMQEMISKGIEKQIAKAHVPEGQAAQARAVGEKWGFIMGEAGAFVAPVAIAFATPFGWGLILWLIGTKALKTNFPYLKAVEVAGLASAITVLETIIKTLLIFGVGNLFATPSPALLVKDFDPNNPSHSLLAVANVMTFWVLAVRSVGLARLSGAPFSRAAAWVFGIWAAYTSAIIGFGLAARAAFGG